MCIRDRRQTVGRHVGADGADVDVSQLVDTLGVRLGQDKIFRLTPVESALPERAVRRIPALHPAQGVAWPVSYTHLHSKRLLWCGEKRTEKTIAAFFDWFGEERNANLKFVCSCLLYTSRCV